MPGLIIDRGLGESVQTDGPCKVTVTRIGRRRVRLAIEADPNVLILRGELLKLPVEPLPVIDKTNDPNREHGEAGA